MMLVKASAPNTTTAWLGQIDGVDVWPLTEKLLAMGKVFALDLDAPSYCLLPVETATTAWNPGPDWASLTEALSLDVRRAAGDRQAKALWCSKPIQRSIDGLGHQVYCHVAFDDPVAHAADRFTRMLYGLWRGRDPSVSYDTAPATPPPPNPGGTT